MLISLNEYVTDPQMNSLVSKHTPRNLSGERTYMNTDWDGVVDSMASWGLELDVLQDYMDRLVERLSL